ncbi:hypothetical protein IMSHALPRED_005838 [Imshaugia aleurites]|uniref:Uncharacterized protein n=1 Tax=Imshaugia aleurites TaxID=172621 RepID=A0A8H3IR85_9LECA|nr:hypothetical protein IMSHALPRED_005838 [Imshaugia aleurites]
MHRGKFRYVTKDTCLSVNPNLYHLPPLSSFNDVLILPVKDIRPSLSLGDTSPYILPYHGFTARLHPSRLHSPPYDRSSWRKQELIKTVYMPEVEELVKKLTGCKSTLVESAVLRTNVHSEVDSLSKEDPGADLSDEDAGPCPRMIGFSSAGGASPAPKVHLDFSPLGARTHIRKYHRNLAIAAESVIQAENKLLKSDVNWNELKDHYRGTGEGDDGVPRFALFSVWRPLKTVHRDPLGLSTCASFPTSDYVPVDIVEPTGRNIPPHLSHIYALHQDSIEGHQQTTVNEKAATHLSNSYVACAPSDRDGTGHGWHFISKQEPTEVLIIQLFDNEMEATMASRRGNEDGAVSSDISVSGVMHSAFELEGQDEAGAARESLEVRIVAFW